MEPTVRKLVAEMVDREAIVVRVERKCVLEMEDEVGQGQQGCRETWLITTAEKLTSSPFLAHTGRCVVWSGQMLGRFSAMVGKPEWDE